MEFDKTKNTDTIYLSNSIRYHRYKKFKNKIDELTDLIDELTDLGEDYSIFQNAKISHKSLKKIQRDLKNVG